MNLFNSKKILSALAVSTLLVGCGGGSSSSASNLERQSDYKSVNKDITITGSNQIFTINKASGNNHIKLHINGSKSIYAIVTSRFDNQAINISSSLNTNTPKEFKQSYKKLNIKQDVLAKKSRIFTPNSVLEFREEVDNLLHRVSDANITTAKPNYRLNNKNERETSASFCVGMDSSHNCTASIDATIKKVVANVNTAHGKKTLVVWLEQGNTQVNQSDINNLANIFLKSGGDNDIYDWDTNIYGSEWGADAQEADANLIPNNNIINILLYNMNNGSLAGYFWPKDNFKSSNIPASNEKIMFYINTQLLRIDAKETYTTLAHEFQHMIHFYQRNVLRGIKDSTWFDELMSETTEDLLATKIGYHGPRNVNPYDGTAGRAGNRGGRFPNFNRYNTSSINTWYNIASDYSKVSSFGTYLIRNYGGASLLNKLMYSDNSDENAIREATGISDFKELVRRWGTAVVLSDKTNAPQKYQYNFGDFKPTEFNGIRYSLGSINFFNYTPNPRFNSSATLENNANLYYKAGYNLHGDVELNINIEKGADITIIAK